MGRFQLPHAARSQRRSSAHGRRSPCSSCAPRPRLACGPDGGTAKAPPTHAHNLGEAKLCSLFEVLKPRCFHAASLRRPNRSSLACSAKRASGLQDGASNRSSRSRRASGLRVGALTRSSHTYSVGEVPVLRTVPRIAQADGWRAARFLGRCP